MQFPNAGQRIIYYVDTIKIAVWPSEFGVVFNVYDAVDLSNNKQKMFIADPNQRWYQRLYEGNRSVAAIQNKALKHAQRLVQTNAQYRMQREKNKDLIIQNAKIVDSLQPIESDKS